MKTHNIISIKQCCVYYEVEESFLESLNEHGLITLNKAGDESFIEYEQLGDLEKFIHLHYELEINMEGLESIAHLLNRVRDLQNEVKRLKNALDEGHGGH